MVVIARVAGKPAGLGRLVEISPTVAELGGIYVFAAFRNQGVAKEIVSYLLKNAKKDLKEIYCLPFKNLAEFYMSYGFKSNSDHNGIPKEIQKKYNWCTQHYPSDVLLLYLKKGDED
jgi:N-acetylglutamate synthase-like GNAT family acetyltransferase